MIIHDYPIYEMENQIHVWNHQADILLFQWLTIINHY